MTIDGQLLSYIIRNNDLLGVQRAGIDRDYFVDEWRTVFNYLVRARREHDTVPSLDTVSARFPDAEFPRVRRSELPMLISDINNRRRYIRFLEALNSAASSAGSQEEVDEAIQALQGQLNVIGYQDGHESHLVDLFTKDVSKRLVKEMKTRGSAEFAGLRTGLKKFDTICGGLHKQRMITVMARSGVGKSWMDLFFVANGVIAGAKVILYPLEMTLFETATRLYSIFTQEMFGPTRALKNLDLVQGKISVAKVARFTSLLEDKFSGQLLVADVASLSSEYTVERIEAEVEMHHPDMFWVDYLTLLKAPGGGRDDKGWEAVGRLSKGIKSTAHRRNCIGGVSAQVNRDALKAGAKLNSIPRLEHISYGDSIGQDADQVFGLIKPGRDIYYGLVKNRHGPEIGRTKVTTDFNRGLLREATEQDEDDE